MPVKIRGARNTVRRTLRGAIALAMTAAIGSAALAQDTDPPTPPTPPTPQEVVANCLEHLHAIARAGADAMHGQTVAGVEHIGALAQDGAPARRIVLTGDATKKRCSRTALAAQQALDAELSRCTQMLRRLEAPPVAFETIREGRRRAGHAVGDALTACTRHVNHAVARALDSLGDDAHTQPASIGSRAAPLE